MRRHSDSKRRRRTRSEQGPPLRLAGKSSSARLRLSARRCKNSKGDWQRFPPMLRKVQQQRKQRRRRRRRQSRAGRRQQQRGQSWRKSRSSLVRNCRRGCCRSPRSPQSWTRQGRSATMRSASVPMQKRRLKSTRRLCWSSRRQLPACSRLSKAHPSTLAQRIRRRPRLRRLLTPRPRRRKHRPCRLQLRSPRRRSLLPPKHPVPRRQQCKLRQLGPHKRRHAQGMRPSRARRRPRSPRLLARLHSLQWASHHAAGGVLHLWPAECGGQHLPAAAG
mmetsp:Transcript_15514/g.60682  ORF Transcript_15514/g.60682 Transcript_15514/m.60682 type:complete len:276 (+) Transcript_15514:1127-1954(+)